MIENTLTLNPWLEDVVQQYHTSRSDSYLRDWYKMFIDNGENLTWQEFLVKSSLEAHLKKNPLLWKPLELLPLSGKTKDVLYWTGVDSLYDLLQITKEELDAICVNEVPAIDEITKCLAKLGKKLRSYPSRTSKLSLYYGYWAIPSPGASHCFNIARPTLREEWFNEYYMLKEHVEGEERLDGDLRSVTLKEAVPKSFKEFWNEVRDFFDFYESICRKQRLPNPIPTPFIPVGNKIFNFKNDSFKELRMQSIRAFIDVMERTRLFRHVTPGDYLRVNLAQDRANVAEKESGEDANEAFASLLSSFILITIDFEDLLWELMDAVEMPQGQGHHPFASAIRRLRENVSDESLRERYRKELEENPDLSWEEFIVQTAIAEP